MMEHEEEQPLRVHVEAVRAVAGWQEAVCIRRGDFFEVGRYVEGSTEFISLTPLWSNRAGAWRDALQRLKQEDEAAITSTKLAAIILQLVDDLEWSAITGPKEQVQHIAKLIDLHRGRV